MTVRIRIPTPLRRFTDNKEVVEVEAKTVEEAIQALSHAHPGIREKICDADGALRRFVNVYVGADDVRFLDKEKTVLSAGQELSIVPAIAGGSAR